MAKSPKSKKKEKKLDLSISQITEVVPLAKRTKKEQRARDKLQKFSKELNKDAWLKAVKLVKGEWNPFPEFQRCYASVKANNERDVGVNQQLLLEFKKAVLSRNWTNAVKLAKVIFKNFPSFNERVHLQVFLSVLMSNPQVDERVLTNACSFLWKMDKEEAMAELMRCFCSMPKKLPSEFISTDRKRRVFVRRSRDLRDKKSQLGIAYTAHLGASSDNDMYIE